MTFALFDSHCHLHDPRYEGTRDGMLGRARQAGVVGALTCGTSPTDWQATLDLCRRASGIHPALGLHPWYVDSAPVDWLPRLRAHLSGSAAAVGECGLDFAVETPNREVQLEALRQQWRLAIDLDRPLTLHCRKAFPALMELARAEGMPPSGAAIHAYSGSAEQAVELQDLGFHLSFGCSLANPANHRSPKALKAVRPDRLLLETDSPDLPPRHLPGWVEGQLNEPAHLPCVLRAAAAQLGLDEAALAEQTTRNAQRLFRAEP